MTTLVDVVLVVAVSAVTSFLATLVHQRVPLRALLPMRRRKPVDPDVMAGILRSAARTAVNGQPPGTPPSAPRPPVE